MLIDYFCFLLFSSCSEFSFIILGSGKSSLINSIFGNGVADVSDSVPLTQNYSRFAPDDKPVVVYDSKVSFHGCMYLWSVSFRSVTHI